MNENNDNIIPQEENGLQSAPENYSQNTEIQSETTQTEKEEASNEPQEQAPPPGNSD